MILSPFKTLVAFKYDKNSDGSFTIYESLNRTLVNSINILKGYDKQEELMLINDGKSGQVFITQIMIQKVLLSLIFNKKDLDRRSTWLYNDSTYI